MTKEIPILDSCDVLVCGGGFGGISAALAAARLGKRVILLEKQYILGGLGTAGLVTIYLPLCDGVGHQVSFGLAEELLRLSISMGAEDEYPANWLDRTDPAGRTEKDHRFRVRYNPWLFAILAEQELVKAGVKILYGCYAVDAEVREDRIHSVIVEASPAGRGYAPAPWWTPRETPALPILPRADGNQSAGQHSGGVVLLSGQRGLSAQHAGLFRRSGGGRRRTDGASPA